MIFSTIDRYIAKSILGAIFMTLFALVGLSAIIKFIEQFRNVGEGTYTIWKALLFTILTIPKDIETFFPMSALLGSLISLGGLASRSELVVMQSSGLSRMRIAMAVIKSAIPLVILSMIFAEWGVPQTEKFARDMRTKAFYGGTILSDKNYLWAKDGNDFIFINRLTDNKKLSHVNIYHFNHQRQLSSLTHAESAEFTDNGWVLNNLNISNIGKDQITTTFISQQHWNTSLTPDKLNVASVRQSSLSTTGLYKYIQFMKQSGQNYKRFELTFWQKIFLPITVSTMMLLALSFIFGQLRSVNAGTRIVVGIVFGFLFYIANEIFGKICLLFDVPTFIGAIMPSLAFMLLIWHLMNKQN